MFKKLKDAFKHEQKPRKDGLDAYTLQVKQTSQDLPRTQLLAEQEAYFKAVQKIQSENPEKFPKIIRHEKGAIAPLLIVVCTADIAEKLRNTDGVIGVWNGMGHNVKQILKAKGSMKIEPL